MNITSHLYTFVMSFGKKFSIAIKFTKFLFNKFVKNDSFGKKFRLMIFFKRDSAKVAFDKISITLL